MKIIYLLTIIFALLSCKDENKNVYEIQVQIINNTDTKIDSVKVYTTAGICCKCDSVLIPEIPPNADETIQWYDILPCGSDGTFLVKAFLNEKVLEKSSGYYTNGILLDKKISISTYSDSIVITTFRK
jgi:hypothetical protein